jgi:hypothetical protein
MKEGIKMEWYLWLAAVPAGIFCWFLVGALTERVVRRVYDPTGKNGTGSELLFWFGFISPVIYAVIVLFVLLLGKLPVGSKVLSFFRWVRGVK